MAHELAHHRRRDLLWNWLPTIAAALLPMHPLVWPCNRRWRLAAESACDADALAATRADVSTYGRMIVNVAVAPFPVPGVLTVAAAGESRWLLKQRLVAMANVSHWKRRQTLTAGALVVVAAACGALPWKVVAQAVPATQPLQSPGPVTHGNQTGRPTVPGAEPDPDLTAPPPAHLLPMYETVGPAPAEDRRVRLSDATVEAINTSNGVETATISLGSNAGLTLGKYVLIYDRPLIDGRRGKLVGSLTVTSLEPSQATGRLDGPQLDDLHVGMKTMVEFGIPTAADADPATAPSPHDTDGSGVPNPGPTTSSVASPSVITQGTVSASTINIRSLINATPEQVNVVERQRVHKGDLLVQFQSRGQQAVETEEKILKDTDDRYKLVSLMASKGVATVDEVARAKLDLDRARDMLQQRQFELAQSRIVAPTDAIVVALQAAPGQSVLTGDTLMMLVRTDVLSVFLPATATNVSRITPGMILRFNRTTTPERHRRPVSAGWSG